MTLVARAASTSSTASTTRSSTGSRSGCTRRADALEFERAARLRDQLVSVRKAIERQQMVGAKRGGLRPHRDRRGPARSVGAGLLRAQGPRRRPQGPRSSTRSRTSRRPALVGRRRSSSSTPTPRPTDIPQRDPRPGRARGPRPLRGVPRAEARQQGARPRARNAARKRELLETVTQQRATRRSRATSCKRASDHNARARALVALQEALGLPEAPLRIECFDISNLQGTEIVASMVVMEDGLAEALRLPALQGPQTLDGQDDFASMEEVLTRRFRRYLRERDEGARSRQAVRVPAEPARDRRRQGPARRRGARARGARPRGHLRGEPRQAVRGGVPARAQSEPVRIPRDSEALYLLQQVRDEAHRFAITYHRQLRGKKMTASVLDDVPGLGPDPQARGCSRSSARSRSCAS